MLLHFANARHPFAVSHCVLIAILCPVSYTEHHNAHLLSSNVNTKTPHTSHSYLSTASRMSRRQSWHEPTVAEVEADLNAAFEMDEPVAPVTSYTRPSVRGKHTGIAGASRNSPRVAGYPDFTTSARAQRAARPRTTRRSSGFFAWRPRITKVSLRVPHTDKQLSSR